MSDNSQDYAQKPQPNCTFMNSSSVQTSQIKTRFFVASKTRSKEILVHTSECRTYDLFTYLYCTNIQQKLVQLIQIFKVTLSVNWTAFVTRYFLHRCSQIESRCEVLCIVCQTIPFIKYIIIGTNFSFKRPYIFVHLVQYMCIGFITGEAWTFDYTHFPALLT